jgi:hypothetical protein
MNGFYFKISYGVADLRNLFVEADILHFVEKIYARLNNWVDSLSVPTATGAALDSWGEMYGVGRSNPCETDEHLRKRIKAMF